MGKVVTYNGKYVKGSSGRIASVSGTPVDPYNPLGLPPFTLRVEFTDTDASYDPTQDTWSAGSWTAVGESVWDWTYQETNWGNSKRSVLSYFNGATGLWNALVGSKHCNILGGNTTGVTNMTKLLNTQRYLGSIALFDTSSVVNFTYFCNGHNRGSILTSIPLFPTSSAVNVTGMFENARNVKSGALALYTQMSTQATPPTTYSNCFSNCGRGTSEGRAELAQIPTSWGGTAT